MTRRRSRTRPGTIGGGPCSICAMRSVSTRVAPSLKKGACATSCIWRRGFVEKVTGQLGCAVPEEPSDLSKCGALLWTVLGYEEGFGGYAPGVNQSFAALGADSSHRPPRHRRDACSMAWRCKFLAARPSQVGGVLKRASQRHPECCRAPSFCVVGGRGSVKEGVRKIATRAGPATPRSSKRLVPNWETFVKNAEEAPAGFFDKRADLGQRLRRAAPRVAAQLAPTAFRRVPRPRRPQGDERVLTER